MARSLRRSGHRRFQARIGRCDCLGTRVRPDLSRVAVVGERPGERPIVLCGGGFDQARRRVRWRQLVADALALLAGLAAPFDLRSELRVAGSTVVGVMRRRFDEATWTCWAVHPLRRRRQGVRVLQWRGLCGGCRGVSEGEMQDGGDVAVDER